MGFGQVVVHVIHVDRVDFVGRHVHVGSELKPIDAESCAPLWPTPQREVVGHTVLEEVSLVCLLLVRSC